MNPYPSSAQLRREADVERMAADDIATALAHRAILHTAIIGLSRLRYRTGCPVKGYDMADILAQLRDMQPPCDPEMERAILERAMELV